MPKKQERKREPENNYVLPSAMPAAPDVERAVLGAFFLSEMAYEEAIAAGLRREDFFEDAHRRIFRAIQQLINDRKIPDMILVVEELARGKELEAVGDVAYVSSLLDGVPDRPSIKPYVEILKEKSMRRGVIHLANSAISQAVSPSDPVKWTVSGMQEDLLRIQGDITQEGVFIKEFSGAVLDTVQEQMYSDRGVIGLPFGIPELDDATTGMRDGEFIPLAGWPGSGKTAFAVDVMRKNAKMGTPVAFFSVEMRKEEILHRIWCQESEISYANLRNPKNLSKQEFREIQEKWRPMVDRYPLKIDDQVRDINEIVPRARLYVKRYGVKLVVVDFIQIVTAPGEKEYERVSYVTDALTALGKDTGVPVLGLSQLTKPDGKKTAANVIPTIEMLRSSGNLGQNAHLVLFTYHPEDDNGDPTGEDLIVIGKQRAGIRGRVMMYFDGRCQKWDERVRKEPAPQQEKIFNQPQPSVQPEEES